MNYLELHDAVKNGTIVSACDVNGKKIDYLFQRAAACAGSNRAAADADTVFRNSRLHAIRNS